MLIRSNDLCVPSFSHNLIVFSLYHTAHLESEIVPGRVIFSLIEEKTGKERTPVTGETQEITIEKEGALCKAGYYRGTRKSRTHLDIIRSTLTVQRCVDYILRTVLLPFLSAVPWPYFSEDMARPHAARARVAMNYLAACQTLPWPARWPDLSSIEHV
ncbi:transposable element Tcb1 transposase [Trichonephila clavipes]|nr:transposable element Tcb1 transposase [Trichonephila clavipes]